MHRRGFCFCELLRNEAEAGKILKSGLKVFIRAGESTALFVISSIFVIKRHFVIERHSSFVIASLRHCVIRVIRVIASFGCCDK